MDVSVCLSVLRKTGTHSILLTIIATTKKLPYCNTKKAVKRSFDFYNQFSRNASDEKRKCKMLQLLKKFFIRYDSLILFFLYFLVLFYTFLFIRFFF